MSKINPPHVNRMNILKFFFISLVLITTDPGYGTEITRFLLSYETSLAIVPVNGSLAKTPDTDLVSEGTEVSALLTPGSGGTFTDILEYRTFGENWSNWMAYTSGAGINTEGLGMVEIRTHRVAIPDTMPYVTVSWMTSPVVLLTSSGSTCVSEPYAVTDGSVATISGAYGWRENGDGSITSGVNTLTPTYTPAASDAGRTVNLTLTAFSQVPEALPLGFSFYEGSGGSAGTYGTWRGGGGAGGITIKDLSGTTINPISPATQGGGTNGGQFGFGGIGFGAGGGGCGTWYVMYTAGGRGANGFAYLFSETEEFFTQTAGTYTVQNDGVMHLLLMGGGASGGGGYGDGNTIRAGGGAGYINLYEVPVTAGTVINITVGAGGAGTTSGGNNGGTTIADISGTLYTAAGGYHGGISSYGGNGSSAGGACTSSPVGFTNGYSGGRAGTGTTGSGTEYFSLMINANKAIKKNFSLTVNPTPVAVTVSGGGDVCSEAVLTASGGTGGTIFWQGTTSGGTSTSTPSSSQTVTSSGTYYFRAMSADGCWGPEGSAEVNITPLPAAPSPVTASPEMICAGQSSLLNATSAGNTIYWFTQPAGGTSAVSSESGADYSVTPPVTTTYYAEARTGANSLLGNTGSAYEYLGYYTLGYDFTPSSDITVTGFRRLFGIKATIWTTTGEVIYSQSISGTNGVWTNNPFETGVQLTGGTTYRIGVLSETTFFFNLTTYPVISDWGVIQQACERYGDGFPTFIYPTGSGQPLFLIDLMFPGAECISATRTPVTVTVEATPVAGTLARTPDVDNVCEGTAVSAALTAGAGGNGTDELEYRTSTTTGWSGWTAYTSGTDIATTGTSAVEIRTRRTATYCDNTVYTTISWIIDETPAAVTVSGGGDVCSEAVLIASGGTGGTIYWQGTTSGGTSTSTPSSSQTVTSGGTYYFRAMSANGCWGPEGSAEVYITPISEPTSVTASPDILCSGQSTQLNATSPGNLILWYTESTGGESIGRSSSGTDFTVSPLLTTTYYAESRTGANNLLGDIIHLRALQGTYTLGYDFTPAYDMIVTGFRRYFGSKATIWTTSGEVVYSQTVSGTDGTWTNNLFSTGVQLTGGTTYRIGVLAQNSYYYWNTTGMPLETDRGVINQGCESWGDNFPRSTYSGQNTPQWFIDLIFAGAECISATRTPVTVTVEATPVAGTLARTPDVDNVCEGTAVSALLTAGAGGNGADELEYRTSTTTGWSGWTAYTSGTDIATTGKSAVEIRTRRTATYCDNTDYTTISWNVEATPVAGTLAKTPDVTNVCEGTAVSALLTAGAGGNGADELEYRTSTTTGWSGWTAYTSGTDIATTGKSAVEIRTRRTATYCDNIEYAAISWSVEATPVAGTLAKTPDVTNVCEGTAVSAVLTAGAGGNGADELEYRTSTTTGWSGWTAYTSGTDIATTGTSAVEIRTRRTASYCDNTDYTTISWNVEATPVAGTLTKTPDLADVCEGTAVSAVLTAGAGGNGADELEYRTSTTTGWSGWTAYTSGTEIATTGKSAVEIRTRRTASYCDNTDYTTISWNVEATPVAGTLAKTPDVDNVCEGTAVSALLTAGAGGNGTDELEYRTSTTTGWSGWTAYTSGADIATTGKSAVEIRTRRTSTYCDNTDYTTISWNVEATPVAGTLAKSPDVTNVCEGTAVSAVLTAGAGGNGADELEYRTSTTTGWSGWTAYTSGTEIATTGKSAVEIRTRRTSTYCDNTDYTTISWNVEATPVAGILTKTPDVANICEGTAVSALLTAGAGGNGTDELEYRTSTTTGWSGWTAYTSGADIATTGKSAVEIRTRRTASYCDNTDYTTISWSVEATPVAGTLAKTPDVTNVCEGTAVSALLTAGAGGNGVDELEYRTSTTTGWSGWTAYTSGTDIATTGKSAVEIRTRRTASYCDNTEYTTISWNVEATPAAGTLAKSPDVTNVCEGTAVSALLTAGAGGNGADELEYRTSTTTGWSGWTAYTSGTDIATTGKSAVEIRTSRTATYCDNTDYTTISWNVEATPVAGTLAKTPDVADVCEGTAVSALLTAGAGGNGADELEYRTSTTIGWSGWTAYTSGTDIATTGKSAVEIRTRRTATYCDNTDYTTISWNVEATPVAGTIVKNPDVQAVCLGESVSATLVPGDGGNGTDHLEFRQLTSGVWTSWTSYVQGTEISSAGLSAIELRTWREASWCSNSDTVSTGWIIDIPTVAGQIEGANLVCPGNNYTVLTNTGYTGEIVMWQSSTDYWLTAVNIPVTTPQLIVEDLEQSTQYRTIVQNGSCNQEYSMAAEIGVASVPEPFIEGEASTCENAQVTYVTLPDMLNYEWNVSAGTIISGQGTNQVEVIWDNSGDQSVSVCYATPWGCTLSTPYELLVLVKQAPEKPVITIDWSTLLLTSSALSGNQWLFNGNEITGATEQNWQVIENGDYNLLVTDIEGCRSELSDTLHILNVDVNTSLDISIQIYPNPNNGIFTLEFSGPAVEDYELLIIDGMGKQVYYNEFKNVSAVNRTINLNENSTGVYKLLLRHADKLTVRKVVVIQD